MKRILLFALVAVFLVAFLTSVSFAAFTTPSVDSGKLKVQTLTAINPSTGQAVLMVLVIKGNGLGTLYLNLEKQTLFKQKNTTDQPALTTSLKKSQALADDSGNMVVRRDNTFKFIGAGYSYIRSVDQHLAMKQEAPTTISGNRMKNPTHMVNGLFL